MKNKQYDPKGSRGDPPWIYDSWGDPPERWCAPLHRASLRTTVGSAAIFKEQIASSYLLAMTMNGASLRSRVLGSGNLKINGIASSYFLAMTMNSALSFAVCFSGRTCRHRN